MNELQALMGLECLRHVDGILERRRKIFEVYQRELEGCRELRILPYSGNKAYVPILLKDFETRERVYEELKIKCNVYSRRYFYPLLTDFAPYLYARGTCPVAESASRRVLTLPTYHALGLDEVREIATAVKEIIK